MDNKIAIPPNYYSVPFRMGPEMNRILCYEHRFLFEISFEPEIIDRYPIEDISGLPFPIAIKSVILYN